jgi:radical SAM protein with 4Fe4S-binding SPASM domain
MINSYENKVITHVRINIQQEDISIVKKILDDLSFLDKNKFDVYFRRLYKTSNYSGCSLKDKSFIKRCNDELRSLGFPIHVHDLFFRACEGDGGDNTFTLLPDFRMVKCNHDLVSEDWTLGKINPSGDIEWNEKRLNSKDISPFLFKKCSECRYLPVCWGGCPLKRKNLSKGACNYEFYDEDYDRNLIESFERFKK